MSPTLVVGMVGSHGQRGTEASGSGLRTLCWLSIESPVQEDRPSKEAREDGTCGPVGEQ